MSFNRNKKQIRVELKQRIGNSDNLVGGLIWEAEWTDITAYFDKRLSSVSTSLDDATLQGKLEQASVQLRFNNETGKFNPSGVEDSLWSSSQYIYHSRIRVYEFYDSVEQLVDGEKPETLPIIDGLIASEFLYRNNFVVDIQVNSKLDILRDHYILEDTVGRIKSTASQSVIKTIIDLFDNIYTELSVITTGGLFREEIIYDNVTPYSQNNLDITNSIVTEGGGIGGLLRDNTLFFSYFGNTAVQSRNFEEFTGETNVIGIWHFDTTDYNGGIGTTIDDKTSSGYDLTTITSLTNTTGESLDTPWKIGFFEYSARTFYRVFSPVLTDYTVHLIINFELNRLINNTDLTTTFPTIGSPTSRTQRVLNPIFAWSSLGSSDLLIVQTYNSTSVHYTEGFFVDENGDLLYMKAHNVDNGKYVGTSTTPFPSDIVVDYEVKLVNLLGENLFQLLSIGIDDSEEEVYVYINGKQVARVKLDLGYLNTVTKNKLVGCGFGNMWTDISNVTNFFFDLGKVYYSGIKLKDNFSSTIDQDVFMEYQYIFGSSFSIGG